MSMSVDGLVSGMDTTSLITQLIQAEAAPQTALKARLSATQTAASAYRTANTTFLAITAAAEALTSSGVTTARKVAGSELRRHRECGAHGHHRQQPHLLGDGAGLDADDRQQDLVGLADARDVAHDGAGVADRDPRLPRCEQGHRRRRGRRHAHRRGHRHQRRRPRRRAPRSSRSATPTACSSTAETGGSAGAFTVKSATEDAVTAGSGFVQTSAGQDATLDLGGGLTATSSTNTFADLLAGVSVTVSKVDATPVTLTVSTDTDSVTTKVQAMVDAVNAALTEVKRATSNAPGSTATLKGDPR